MAITATDILFKGSGGSSPGNSTAVASPANWLGSYMSSTQITDATLHNIFDLVTGDENAASESEYRCIFIHNNHGSLTWENVKVWINSETAGGASIAISLDTTGVVSATTASTMSKTIANEDTAPTSQTFTSPTSKATGLGSSMNVPSGSAFALWIRRTTANSAALDLDGAVLGVAGDTAA